MGFSLSAAAMNKALAALGAEHTVYAPKRFPGGSNVSDADLVRYGAINAIEDAVFEAKSAVSAKEAFYPMSETLFYFTERETRAGSAPEKKPLVFARSCDIHALERLEDLFLRNGGEDYFFARRYKDARFILMPCAKAFDNCFCVDMQTNKAGRYAMSVEHAGGSYRVTCQDADLEQVIRAYAETELEVAVPFVTKTPVRVRISDAVSGGAAALPLWDEYDSRCVSCGRCTFGCPSCTCWTMQDLFYSDNGRAGERRRVWASCMVDGFTDVAGGGSYRKKNGERMRFRVLHKIYDHKKRFGRAMCVGCGRCDDRCPEYISFSNAINKLTAALEPRSEGGV
ncbi:MAG: anaerobic sulfite reductase subunit AsrA [Treponema sp.]|jgi:anaerobic sulfite reductase subunit A|nr:anaerobic sulfite reductase subunit AsrA [Treponema sp.]